MKKRLLAVLLAGVLTAISAAPVFATETESVEDTAAEEEAVEEGTEGEEAVEEETEAESAGIEIPTGNMVDVDVIDLSLHAETSGEFGPVYAYENPFKGKDTSKGVVLEFYAKPTWEVHELGAIFAFVGSGDYDGKFYFSPGSYLGFNSAGFGGYFDANLFNYTLVTDYIKDGAKMRIEVNPSGFAVYADDVLCYDQSILDDPNAGAGDYTAESDFSPVLEWLSGADVLYFGYGSWWNSVGTNEANIDLSQVNFRLADGTVVMDQLTADKDMVESLGGSVTAGEEETAETVEIGTADVEIFDINSVSYQGTSVLPVMAAVVMLVAVAGVVVAILVMKKHHYNDV